MLNLNFFEFSIDSKKLLACDMQEARLDDVLFSFISNIDRKSVV